MSAPAYFVLMVIGWSIFAFMVVTSCSHKPRAVSVPSNCIEFIHQDLSKENRVFICE